MPVSQIMEPKNQQISLITKKLRIAIADARAQAEIILENLTLDVVNTQTGCGTF